MDNYESSSFEKILTDLALELSNASMVVTQLPIEDIYQEIDAVVKDAYRFNAERVYFQTILEARQGHDIVIEESAETSNLTNEKLMENLIEAELQLVRNIEYIDMLRNSVRLDVSSWLNPEDFKKWFDDASSYYGFGFNIKAFTKNLDEGGNSFYVYNVDVCPFEIIIP